MTPHDIELIRLDLATLDADLVANEFYDTLFDLAPQARSMFPADMGEQRRKLMAELGALVELGTAADEGRIDDFVERARRLGRRHVGYGAEGSHYELVGTALIAALRCAVVGWDAQHEHAWSVLYATVAETMQEGAAARPVGAPPATG